MLRGYAAYALLYLLLGMSVAHAQSKNPNLSPQSVDLACAMATGAQMGASQNHGDTKLRDAATILFTFYLGRLSGRDDSVDWNAVVRGRVAELRDKALDKALFESCEDFYITKIK